MQRKRTFQSLPNTTRIHFCQRLCSRTDKYTNLTVPHNHPTRKIVKQRRLTCTRRTVDTNKLLLRRLQHLHNLVSSIHLPRRRHTPQIAATKIIKIMQSTLRLRTQPIIRNNRRQIGNIHRRFPRISLHPTLLFANLTHFHFSQLNLSLRLPTLSLPFRGRVHMDASNTGSILHRHP